MGISQISDPFSLLNSFSQLPPVKRLVIALSGGLDSVVLLHSLCQVRSELPQQLQAIHIHHGLMPEADSWSRYCAEICQVLDIPLEIIHVRVERESIGLEAAARNARYAVLAEEMDADTALLTAHHQDDQIETVLLHLIKGAGAAGLAGIPVCKSFATGWHFRPLLDFPRQKLSQYASEHELDFIEDSSNQDRQFERNYLRHQVIPELKSRWPAVGAGVARAARNQSDLLSLSNAQAQMDLPGVANADGSMDIHRLKQLSLPRQNNVLRFWLRELGGEDENPSAANLDSIRRELIGSAWDREPELLLGSTRIYRFRNLLYREPADSILRQKINPSSFTWRLNQPFSLDYLGLYFESASVLNYFPQLSSADCLRISFRQGGEKIRLPDFDHHKSLKKLFQAWGVPPWRRHRIPLLFHGERLLVVWGYAVAQINAVENHS